MYRVTATNTAKISPAIKERERIFRFRLFLTLIALWVLVQSVTMMQPLNYEVISALFFLKNPMGAIAIVIGTLLYLDRIKLSRLWVPAFLFCTYVLLNLSFRNIAPSDLFPPMMYFLWSWALFIVAPAVFSTGKSVESYLRVAVWVTVCVVVIGWVVSMEAGYPLAEVTGGNREGALRYFFGFRHAGYFSTVAVSVLLGSLLLRRLSASIAERRVLLVVAIVFAVMLYFADSRSSNILALSAILVDWTLNQKGRQKRIVAILLWFMFMLFFASSILHISAQEDPLAYLNYGSSGRIEMWVQAIGVYLDSPWAIVLGNGVLRPLWEPGIRKVEGGGVVEATFTVFRIDSTYLEILVLYGLVGLALFVAILATIVSLSLKSIRECASAEHRRVVTMAFGIICGILLMAIPTSIIPSMGNLVNVILLLSCMCIIQLKGAESIH